MPQPEVRRLAAVLSLNVVGYARLVQLDEAAAREEAAAVHMGATQIERLLTRHLADEEDLAVPIILHHKLSG